MPLPEGVDLSAYRIVQEALSNAMRHAPGSHVQVRLFYRGDGLALEVRNDAAPLRGRPGPGGQRGPGSPAAAMASSACVSGPPCWAGAWTRARPKTAGSW